jgi:hypothetical protein
MSDMHPDLKFLARNVSEWNDAQTFANVMRWQIDDEPSLYWSSITEDDHKVTQWVEHQWLQARQLLGLESPEVTEAEDEAWEAMEEKQNRQKYSAYFKDVRHLDYIDVYRTVSLFGCEKHGHAISHAAKKLLLTGVRTGGKSVEQEVREAIDTLSRWLEMREEDKVNDR